MSGEPWSRGWNASTTEPELNGRTRMVGEEKIDLGGENGCERKARQRRDNSPRNRDVSAIRRERKRDGLQPKRGADRE